MSKSNGRTSKKETARKKRKIRIAKKMRPERGYPRLVVFRSNKHIYAQLIDDLSGKVLTSTSTAGKKGSSLSNNVDGAKQVGAEIGKRAKELNVTRISFDRNGYKFHGRVKALADAARESGLNF